MKDCYYNNEFCQGDTWECLTCGENFCEGHCHSTDKGDNIECVACERTRLEDEENKSLAKARLEYLRGEIKGERIGYEEIAELESLKEYIEPDDVLLLEWAGVPEKAQ